MLDKTNGTVVDAPVKSITADRGFYDVDDKQSLDGFLTTIDSNFGAVVHEIKARQSLVYLDGLSQRILSLGVALQWLRTKRIRELLQRSQQGELNNPDGTRLSESKQWYLDTYGDLSPKTVQLDWLSKWAFELAGSYFRKRWLLLVASGPREFVTCDHPVVNRVRSQPSPHAISLNQGTIYLPITPSLTLAFLDVHDVPQTTKHISALGLSGQILNAESTVTEEEIALMNRLQYDSAQRFVFSRVKEMRDRLIQPSSYS